MTESQTRGGRPATGWRGAAAVLAAVAALALTALASPISAGLVLGALLGAAALLLVAAFVPERLADVLYLALLAAVSIPLDKYFQYQTHVGGWPGLRFSLADIFLVLLGGLAVLAWLLRGDRPIAPAALGVPYALLILQYGAALVGAPRPDLGAFEIAAAVHAAAVAVVVASLFRPRHASAALAVACIMVVVQSGVAIAQTITGRPLGAGLFRPRPEVLKELLATGSVHLRPSGLFDHPIVFADFLLVSLPVVAACAMVARGRLARAGAMMALAIGTTGLVLSLARGAWISSLVAAAVFVLLAVRVGLLQRNGLRRLLVGASAGALVVGIALGPRIYERFTESQTGNLQVRFELNDVALSMIAEHPVTGVGLNNFLAAMPRHDPKDVMRYFPGPVHNMYLLEAAESGIPGLALFVASGVGLIAWTLRRLARVEDPVLRWLSVAIVSSLVGFAFSQVADFSYRLEPLRSVLWCEVGLLVGAVRAGSSREAR